MNKNDTDKMVELNTEETEQVVGGSSPIPANHPASADVRPVDVVRERRLRTEDVRAI